MTEAANRRGHAATLIGPGRLVLVVGPSGAGKDTILNGARAAFATDKTVVFARRVVTRPHDRNEDHDSLDEARFAAAVRDGAFALSWDAHGLRYGVRREIDDEIRAGHTVVSNVSRGVVATARMRYAHVTATLVTAPEHILAARLAARSRATDASLDERLGRNNLYSEFAADVVIVNEGDVDDSVKAFEELLRSISAT